MTRWSACRSSSCRPRARPPSPRRTSLEVQAERVRLELRQPRAEAEHEALELLGRDHADRRLVHRRTRQRVAQRAVALRLLAGRRLAEGDVGVERRMLEAGGGLDRRDDLAGDAELGEAPERGLLVGAEVAHRLVEADQPFLDQILGVTAGGSTSSPSVARSRCSGGSACPSPACRRSARADDELKVFELPLGPLGRGHSGGGSGGHGCSRGLSGARPDQPYGQLDREGSRLNQVLQGSCSGP